jgi:hypothetical protein
MGQYSNTNISGIQYGKVSAAEKNLEAVRNFPKELRKNQNAYLTFPKRSFMINADHAGFQTEQMRKRV